MPSKPGLTDEQRNALVEWLQSDENDGGWNKHAARQSAWAFHDWLEKCGLVVVPDGDRLQGIKTIERPEALAGVYEDGGEAMYWAGYESGVDAQAGLEVVSDEGGSDG